MSECKKIRRLLNLRSADWTPAERKMAETHLSACPSCAALKEECAGQGNLLRTLPAAEMTSIQQRDLFARMAKARGKHVVGSRWSLVWGVAAGLVVLLALAALFSLLLQRTGRLPTGNRALTASVSPQPTATLPAGMAELRGLPISNSMGAIQTFRAGYITNTWQREQNNLDEDALYHQAIPGCILYPGKLVLPSITYNKHLTVESDKYLEKSSEQVALGNYEFRRMSVISSDQAATFISYDLATDSFSFVFALQTTGLMSTTLDHCRTDAEVVLSTLSFDEVQRGPFVITLATLDVSEDPEQWSEKATSWLEYELAAWLDAGNNSAGLGEALNVVPLIDPAKLEVRSIDLEQDGKKGIIVLRGLWGDLTFTICRTGSAGYFCQSDFGVVAGQEPIVTDSALIAQELNGVSGKELVITMTIVSEDRNFEVLQVLALDDPDNFQGIFAAILGREAGPTHWKLEPDPSAPNRQQFVVIYPYLYGNGFENEQLNHPLGRQVWRWSGTEGRFVLTEEVVDTEHSGRGIGVPVTAGDRLWWKTNEAETVFRSGDYETALERYEQVIVLAEGWTPLATEPDWAAYARFRRGECLALLGRAGEAQAELAALVDEYKGDMLGTLAESFLAAYGDGSTPDAAARGVAALPAAQLYAHFSTDESGALRSPLEATGILYSGAGLATYLDAHPELVSDMPALQAGLQEAGFATEQVRRIEDQIYIRLRLPQGSGGERKLLSWGVENREGHWCVAPLVSQWPEPGLAYLGWRIRTIGPREVKETGSPEPSPTLVPIAPPL